MYDDAAMPGIIRSAPARESEGGDLQAGRGRGAGASGGLGWESGNARPACGEIRVILVLTDRNLLHIWPLPTRC